MEKISELALNFLLNASWQVAFVVLVASVCARMLRRAPARYRHALWATSLLLCVALPAWSLIDLSGAMATRANTPTVQTNSSAPAHDLTAPGQSTSGQVAAQQSVSDQREDESRTAPATSLLLRGRRHVATAPRWAMLIPILYALFLLWRACAVWHAWRRAGRIRRSAVAREMPARLAGAASLCRELLGVRRVEILCSDAVSAPVTVGVRSPAVILPESFFADDMPAEVLACALGHEMAHVARRDVLYHLAYELLSLPISFHPLTHFVNRQINRTREIACDELAAAFVLEPKKYARALVRIAGSLAPTANRALTLGVFGADILEERIMKLTRNTRTLGRRTARALTFTAFSMLSLSALAISAFSFSLQTHASPATARDLSFTVEEEPARSAASADARDDSPMLAEQREEQSSRKASAQALGSSDASARARAACEAGRAHDTEAIPSLVSLLGDDSPVEPLRCWDRGTWSPALDSFKHPSPGEQAAIALASMGTRALGPLTHALASRDATVRRNAAWAIGELTNMRAGERAGAGEPLISLLNDTDEWVRMAAARALGEIRDERSVEPLITLLADTDWRARQLAAWALGEMKEASAVEALCGLLVSDARVEVRLTAAEALGEIRNGEALSPLKKALDDVDSRVREKATWAIAEIEDSLF